MKSRFDPSGIRLYRVSGDYPTRIALQKHPDLSNHLKSINPPRIKKDNPTTLELYNRYIAEDLYDLKINFLPGAIIPTPILRFNFLKYVIRPNSSLLEIGTGASAIIAMLAAKHFQCQVTATDVDQSYLNWAQTLIKLNGLDSQIKLVTSNGNIIESIFSPEDQFDFILSNPPYYDEILSPCSPWGGKSHELISEGKYGEGFILRLIKEGWNHLNPAGILAFIVPKTRQTTLCAVESYLQSHSDIWDYDIIGLLAGNRTRYVFRVHKPASKVSAPAYEML